MTTVVVPAHNEEAVLGRLLDQLRTLPPGTPEGALRVIVVCNGCRDATADVARSRPGVTVLETDRPSKAAALRLGDVAAGDDFPRLYVDADVELDGAGALALAAAVADQPDDGSATATVLVAGPSRRTARDQGVSPFVRWYLDVWAALPAVRRGLFARGVVAVGRTGHGRIKDLPEMMSDDLVMSSVFAPHERRIVEEAVVVVHPPRTVGDLLRRRARVVTGTRQAYEGEGAPALAVDSRTTRADLLQVVRERPALAVKLPVFLGVTVLARRRAARAVAAGDYSTWLRDDSSRATTP